MTDELDLNKIAEFMNSEAPVEEVDNQEIENTLDYIDNQLATVKTQTKEIKTPEQAVEQEHTIDELTSIALKQLGKVDHNSDEIYDLFYKPLALGHDHSDASKIALLDSQRLRIEAINALAALASAKAKLELAKSKVNPAGGTYINAQSGAEVGISIHGLYEGLKEEED